MTGAWLFARQGECLWIEHHGGARLLVRIHGPGELERAYAFADLTQLQDFLSAFEERLLDSGWTFQRFESDADGGQARRAPHPLTHPRKTSDVSRS